MILKKTNSNNIFIIGQGDGTYRIFKHEGPLLDYLRDFDAQEPCEVFEVCNHYKLKSNTTFILEKV